MLLLRQQRRPIHSFILCNRYAIRLRSCSRRSIVVSNAIHRRRRNAGLCHVERFRCDYVRHRSFTKCSVHPSVSIRLTWFVADTAHTGMYASIATSAPLAPRTQSRPVAPQNEAKGDKHSSSAIGDGQSYPSPIFVAGPAVRKRL